MRILEHLAISVAMVGLVAPAQAEYYPGSTDFEGDSPLADACWSNVVEAVIEADASVADVPRSPNLPPSFDKTSRTNVLSDSDPALPIYTLTWGEGFDSVSFTTNGVARREASPWNCHPAFVRHRGRNTLPRHDRPSVK